MIISAAAAWDNRCGGWGVNRSLPPSLFQAPRFVAGALLFRVKKYFPEKFR